MSSQATDGLRREGRVIGMGSMAISTLALACMSLISGDVRADDGLLQFEKVTPEEVGRKAVANAEGGGSLRRAIEDVVDTRQSSSAQVIQAVRDSLAPIPMPQPEVSALEFERIDVMAGEMPAAVDVVPRAPASRLDLRVPVFSAADVSQPLPMPSLVAGDVAVFARDRAIPTEAELRDIFLRVVDAAAARSPAVARALAERSASEADVAEARGQRLPQVEVGGRSHTMQFGSGGRGETSDPTLSLDVTTPIFDWGRIRKTVESRSQMANAAEWAFEAELESSAYDATSNLVELGKQRIIVEISQEYVDRMSKLVKMLEGIVAIDAGRVSELTQARARLLQAEASRSAADSRARDIEINLRRMVGDRPLPTLPSSRYWDVRLPELTWLLAEAAGHPVIRQAEAQATSSDLQADVIRSASLPQVNWVVGKTTGGGSSGRELAWQTGLALSWSAFRGGSARASQRAARQRAEAGWKAAEQQALDLEYRIRASNQDARSLVDRAELYRGLTVESNKVREAFYEQWYHLGRRTLLDVLSSESEHYNNQVGEVSNRFDGYQAVMRQYASAGALIRWLSPSRP